jgi:hypothetical protein
MRQHVTYPHETMSTDTTTHKPSLIADLDHNLANLSLVLHGFESRNRVLIIEDLRDNGLDAVLFSEPCEVGSRITAEGYAALHCLRISSAISHAARTYLLCLRTTGSERSLQEYLEMHSKSLSH